MVKYKIKKIKVILKNKESSHVWIYLIEHYHGIAEVRFVYDDGHGWCLTGSGYRWNRSFILFAESIIRGLNSNE